MQTNYFASIRTQRDELLIMELITLFCNSIDETGNISYMRTPIAAIKMLKHIFMI